MTDRTYLSALASKKGNRQGRLVLLFVELRELRGTQTGIGYRDGVFFKNLEVSDRLKIGWRFVCFFLAYFAPGLYIIVVSTFDFTLSDGVDRHFQG